MTINTTTSSVTVLGNGATTVFSYSFMIPGGSTTDKTNVTLTQVTAAGVSTVIPSGSFSITGVGTGSGTFTYSPAIASGVTLTLARVVPLTQTTTFDNIGALYPHVIETTFDTTAMQVQQVARSALLSLQFPLTDSNPIVTLPPSAARANGGSGSILGFDGVTGNPTVLAGVTSPSVSVSVTMAPFLAYNSLSAAFTYLAGSAATINGTLGGLTGLTVASGGMAVTGNSTITGTLGGLTGLTIASGSLTLPSPLPVATGGTGVATLAANGVVIANGASPLTALAPGAANTVLTSNGTTLSFVAPAAGAVNSFNTRSGAVTLTATDVAAAFPAAGAVGAFARLENRSGSAVAYGANVAGTSLFPTGGSAQSGVWTAYEYAPNLVLVCCSPTYSSALFRRLS